MSLRQASTAPGGAVSAWRLRAGVRARCDAHEVAAAVLAALAALDLPQCVAGVGEAVDPVRAGRLGVAAVGVAVAERAADVAVAARRVAEAGFVEAEPAVLERGPDPRLARQA